jgi:hypothetical protein
VSSGETFYMPWMIMYCSCFLFALAREREEEEDAQKQRQRLNTLQSSRIATPGLREPRTPRRRGFGL